MNSSQMKFKYKGNSFIFICAEKQTHRHTNRHTDRQTDKNLNGVAKTSRSARLRRASRQILESLTKDSSSMSCTQTYKKNNKNAKLHLLFQNNKDLSAVEFMPSVHWNCDFFFAISKTRGSLYVNTNSCSFKGCELNLQHYLFCSRDTFYAPQRFYRNRPRNIMMLAANK